MMTFLRKTVRYISKATLALIALLLVGLIAIQIVLIIGINLVSTGKGSFFISGKINEAIAGSGYSINFDGLYYDPVRGISIHDLAVSDTQGTFLTLDRFSAGIDFILGPLRTLDLHAQGGTLSLYRLPVSPDNDDEADTKEALAPFETPDIYIRKFVLSSFSFKQVILGEDVAGTPYIFAPSLQGHLTLDEHISLAATLKPGLPEIAPNIEAPDEIAFLGKFTPHTLYFILDELSVDAKSYTIDAKGTGSLLEQGSLSIVANARHTDLSALTSGAIDNASADITIDGPLNGPALDLSARLVAGNLKERGLSDDIKITVKTADISEGMKGLVHIETAFKNDPVTLGSALSYEAPFLQITDIKGSAPDITITGGGVISTETSLFDGELKLFATDLAHYSDIAGITLSGKLDAVAAFKISDVNAQAVDISASATRLIADTIKVKSLSAQASIATLLHPWPQSAKLDVTSLQVSDEITLDKLSAAVAANGDESYKLTVKGAGNVPVAIAFDGSAMLSNMQQSIPDIRDIAMSIKQGLSSVQLSGGFTSEHVDLKLSAKNVRAQDLPTSIPSQFDTVRIDLNAAMSGAPARPLTDIDMALRGIGAGEYQNASININARHDGDIVSVKLSGQGTGIRKLDADASFPMTLSLLPFSFTLDTGAALSGTVVGDIDLAALSPLFLPPTQSLSGALTANGTIGGTIAAPQPAATIRLSSGSFEDGGNGIVLADLAAAASITGTGLTLNSLSATDGKEGTLSGSGSLAFDGGAADVSLRMRNFNIPNSNLANGIVGADLSLKGSADGMHLSGSADIEEMNVLIPEKFSSNIPQLNIVEDEQDDGTSILERLTLDITIDASNQIFVRGWGLDAEFGGAIAVSGTAPSPQLNGTLESRRGRYEEFGKRFTLARANLRFQGNVPPSPYLDIEATTPAGDVTGSILLTGPVQSPSIKFASTPALPEDEVLSRILFGKDSSRISPYQAIQLAQAVRRFSGQGGGAGFDPLSMIRSATGLDDISVETDESGAATVEAGKYLTDNVYLEFSKGKDEGSGAATIQIEVTPSINIESRMGQDAQGGGGVFWKHDY